jgi:transcriptional regulator with XRE-family HTH domain
VNRAELADFLRRGRARLDPSDVGLAAGARRRTPGLRREEVAQLAGVGVTWYTWLEQGRDIRASDQVLDAIARTLMFDPHERAHLYTLSGNPPPAIEQECRALPASTQQLLDQLEPFPASVTNARYDVLAFNRTYAHLIEDLNTLPFEDRNSLWLLFTHPAWRAALLDWDDAVHRMVGQYRAAMAEHVAEPAWKCLVKRLRQASPEFAELWERHEVNAPENRTKRIVNPRVGLLRVDYTNLWLGQRLGIRMVTYTPADEETRERLTTLHRLITESPVGATG